MPEIRQLPTSVVNKIAAGEVIERPASVVKELLENSVDAGATRIDVAVEKGGTDLLRIADNGCGIEPEQLPLAVASHATSKIRDADDLFRVGTLGFRGEALASIAEISQLLLRSRVSADAAGAELEVNGGRIGSVVPCGCPPGTCLEIRNLFFNTPVRRKFLRSTQTEMGHVSEAFTRLAVAHPHIHFTLKHNDRPVYDLPPVESWRQRIATFFGDDLAQGLISVESQNDEIRLSGYVANPSFSRGNNRMQYLFLNGRHIRDRSLQHALGEAYRGLLLTGRFPIAFLRLEVPPEIVDVNVHPSKLEVRFQDGGRLYSQLLGTLRNRFLTTDLTARVQSPATAGSDDSVRDPELAHDPLDAQRQRRELVQWATGQADSAAGPPPRMPLRQNALELNYTGTERGTSEGRLPAFQPFGRDLSFEARRPPGVPVPTADYVSENPAGGGPVSAASLPGTAIDWEPGAGYPAREPTSPSLERPPSPSHVPAPHTHFGVQIHDRYLITESPEGMVVIDQHALHERVLYEQLREKVLGGRMEVQQLLVPEPVSLPPAEAAAVLEARDALEQLGIRVEPFGGDTVLISAYPAILANLNPAELLRQVIEGLMANGQVPQRRDLLDELLHMVSCKAAIKAGDRLTTEEIAALLEQRHLYQDTHHCPHGRPTALVFTREELDKRFKRI